MRRCVGIFLGYIVFAGKGLSLPVEPDQVLMGCWLGIGLRLIGLKVEPELEVVGQELLWGFLVNIQQEVLVVAARQSSLVCVNPASGILLLHQITLWLWEAIFPERDTIDGTLYACVADACGGIQTGQVQGGPTSEFWPMVGKVRACTTGSDDGNG